MSNNSKPIKLHFTTSSGIKSIVGKDLITDRFVAVFELVKNAYDAKASQVIVSFDDDLKTFERVIRIEDNGTGMSKDDLVSKWLCLAYSDKEEGQQNNQTSNKEKSQSDSQSRAFVGSKGIGRFSCDSLGSLLTIHTKTKGESSEHILEVDWTKFEQSREMLFEKVAVDYFTSEVEEKNISKSYTKLLIKNTRDDWYADAIEKTIDNLRRLKNPFIEDDGFKIYCGANLISDKLKKSDLVNSNIAEVLKDKSITIEASIGSSIEVELTDRSKSIYKLQKTNDTILKNVNINISIHYLTTSAKSTFTRRMGVEPIKYGNVFIYRNNFRVSPYGDTDYDLFGLNIRKTQGYNRYIGTRELIGYIAIKDEKNLFKETSSRNNGLIHSLYLSALEDIYMEYIHRPLEKYVRLVQWGEDGDTQEAITLNSVKIDETERFKKTLTTKKNGFELKYFANDLDFDKYNPEKQLKKVIASLSSVQKKQATKAIDKLSSLSDENKQQQKALKDSQDKIAALERQTQNLSRNRSEASFVEQLTHHFPALADQLNSSIKEFRAVQSSVADLKENHTYLKALRKVRRTEDELRSLQKLLLQTAVDLRSPQILNWQELTDWYFSNNRAVPKVVVSSDESITDDLWVMRSNASEVIMMLGNLYQNAKEHGASTVNFHFSENQIIVSSDSKSIEESDLEKIFELGYSTKNNGTGIGLNQVKTFLNRINCVIKASNDNGLVQFTISKEGK